jgi:hypothetical protein
MSKFLEHFKVQDAAISASFATDEEYEAYDPLYHYHLEVNDGKFVLCSVRKSQIRSVEHLQRLSGRLVIAEGVLSGLPVFAWPNEV